MVELIKNVCKSKLIIDINLIGMKKMFLLKEKEIKI